MKCLGLFIWAVKRMKVKNEEYVDCIRNDILLKLMDISGVTPMELTEKQ